MKCAIYACPFVPAAWVEAHGVQACREVAFARTDASSLPETGVCPFARSFAGHVLSLDDATGAVFTTRCDQMRRLYDLVSVQRRGPTFLLNVPATWQSTAAEQLYAAELERLGRFLRGLGGHALDREHLLRACTERTLRHESPGEDPGVQDGLIRLAVIGGPLGSSDFLSQVRRAGACVVLDASECSDAMQPAAIDPESLMRDPAGETARAFLGMPSIHQRPDGRLLAWLGRVVADRGVHGVILRRYVWCDLWHGQLQRFVDSLGVPVLDLQVEADVSAAEARAATRLTAFVETLRGEACIGVA